jgi:hypothetical protein
VAPSLITSYYVQLSPQGTSALVTPSFTPSNGEVLVIKLVTWDTAIAMGAPTGGSQTYTSRIINAPGGFNEWAGIYTAVISGSPGAMTVSSTPSASARASMVVERWSGAQLAATPVTASSNGLSAPASGTITPSSGTSVISWCAGDAQAVDPATKAYLNSATNEGVRDDHIGSNGVDYHAWAASTGSSSQSYGLSAPTGMTYVTAAIEVQASVGAAATYPTNLEQRRRLLVAPRQVRGGARIATPVRAQVNPPFPTNGIKQPRRLRGLLARRGEMFTPVPSQAVVAAPSFPPRPVRARLKGLRLYRGEMFAPPSDQLSDAQQYQRPRLRLPRIFRARTASPVPAQIVVAPPAYPPQSVRTRLRGLRIFRGRAAAVVPAQIVVTAPAYPPANVRTRVRGLRLFRGRASAPVPAQIVVTPPSFTPLAVRTRLRFARIFRGRTAAPVPDQLVAPPAPHLRPRGMAPRRGHAAMPVPPQIVVAPPAYPVRPVRPRLKGLRGVRGRQAAMPVPPQVVIVPPKMVPLFTRLKQHAARIFRAESRAVLPPVCDCVTHRPNLGTTSRPSSGITARPDSGTTARPCSCNND